MTAPVTDPAPKPRIVTANPWEHVGYRLRCVPYSAWLTTEGCARNIDTAADALQALREDTEPWEVEMPAIDRLLTCGRCHRGARLQPITTEWILSLIEECLARLDIYANLAADPEVYRQRQREAKRKWAREHPGRDRPH